MHDLCHSLGVYRVYNADLAACSGLRSKPLTKFGKVMDSLVKSKKVNAHFLMVI